MRQFKWNSSFSIEPRQTKSLRGSANYFQIMSMWHEYPVKLRFGSTFAYLIANPQHPKTSSAGPNMNNFQKDIEAQFEKFGREVKNFFEKVTAETECTSAFYPSADIIEDENHVTIILDLPGMVKDDLKISLKESVLTVRGERLITYATDAKVRRQERAAGSFSRSFPVPEDVSSADIKARFRDGVLSIELPRSEVLRNAENIPID